MKTKTRLQGLSTSFGMVLTLAASVCLLTAASTAEKKSHAGSQAARQCDRLEVSAAPPATKSTESGYQHTVSPKPVLSSPEAVTLRAEANNEIPEIIITGQCAGGSRISGPDWLTYETTETDEENFSYKVQLIPSLAGFPKSIPAEQTLTITNKVAKSLTTTVKVSFTEAEPCLEALSGYIDDSGHDPVKGYRVTPSGKTLTISYYSMFTELERLSPEVNYDPAYCTGTNGGNSWLNVTYGKSIEGNRCKYTYSIQVAPATGDDAEYQLHKATLLLKQEGTVVRSYTIWRGVSYVGYPMENGSASPYYTAIKKGYCYWAPVNLGATRVAQAGDGKNMAEAGTGNLYQWGRQDATNHGTLAAPGPTSDSKPNNHTFYKAPDYPSDWLATQCDSLWNDSSKGINDPCPPGYRVPTDTEFMSIGDASIWLNEDNGGLFIVEAEDGYPRLILPAAGRRECDNGDSFGQGFDCDYWSSSVPPGRPTARGMSFDSDTTLEEYMLARAYGFSVRCIQEQKQEDCFFDCSD